MSGRTQPLRVAVIGLVVLCGLTITTVVYFQSAPRNTPWSPAELATIRSLWLGSLPDLPEDLSNRYADSEAAARFGLHLFFDTRFSGNGKVACATCHQPQRGFADGLRVAVGMGVGTRNTMGLVGAAYSPWYFWDGRKDSLWSQALAPMESPVEHGGNRVQFARLILNDTRYVALYEAAFGPLPIESSTGLPLNAAPTGGAELQPAWNGMTAAEQHGVNRLFANMGKALAAYQRKLLPGPSRFDDYAAAVVSADPEQSAGILTAQEIAGLRIFISQGQCTNCHNSALFTNNAFHNTGSLPAPGELPSRGRVSAVRQAQTDPFNCLGAYSDDGSRSCPELRFVAQDAELLGAHRTPSLRNVAETAPYMHAGQLDSLAAVIDQYNQAPAAMLGHNEAKPLGLSARQQRQLEAFLKTLSGSIAAEQRWLQAPEPAPHISSDSP